MRKYSRSFSIVGRPSKAAHQGGYGQCQQSGQFHDAGVGSYRIDRNGAMTVLSVITRSRYSRPSLTLAASRRHQSPAGNANS
jgi:hypothetical protein